MPKQVVPSALWYDVVLFPHEGLEGSDELALGMRDLRRRLPGARRWYVISADKVPEPSIFPDWSDAPHILVILNSALLVSDNLAEELLAVLKAAAAGCILPSDLRGLPAGIVPDYASRPGFDRFVSRLSTVPQWLPFDGRNPWLYLVSRETLMTRAVANLSWEALPAALGSHTLIAGRTYIHSYADYYLNNRAEMLRLLPDSVQTLLDIGGGAGNFGKLFMDERGGQATLLEQNPEMAAIARCKGLLVLEGDFRDVVLNERYDCVTFLDVLEHLAEPLAALLKARQALKPGGYLVISVPNVGHWSVVWDLLEGRFDYIPVGILCTTHLRFFARAHLETLLADAGFSIERWENITAPLPEPFAEFLAQRAAAGITPDFESLATESFHILARSLEGNPPSW